jgi:hypothetical protein
VPGKKPQSLGKYRPNGGLAVDEDVDLRILIMFVP